MFKRYVFPVIAAIAVLIGATSCDKDIYMPTDMKFYRFTGKGTINIYDSELFFIEQGSSNLTMHSQIPLHLSGDTELAPKEGETMRRELDISDLAYGIVDEGEDYTTAEDTVKISFKLNHFVSSVKLTGLNIQAEDKMLVCLDDFILEAKIVTLKKVETPFYQKAEIRFTLKTEDSGILVADAVQEVEIGTKPEQADDESPQTDDSEAGDEDVGEGEDAGTEV